MRSNIFDLPKFNDQLLVDPEIAGIISCLINELENPGTPFERRKEIQDEITQKAKFMKYPPKIGIENP